MNRVKNYISTNKFILLIFVITIFILLLPNFQKELVTGDDYIYHLARIQSITDSIKNGVFPIKVNSTLANNFGYASGMFYPDLFLYVPSIFMVLFGISIIDAYKIFIVIYLSFTFIIFYKSFFYLTNNKYSAIIGTTFLMLSKIVFMLLYQRFALGEFLGFTFILPAIVGMYDYFNNDFKSPQYLVIGFLGLLNCHLITGLIVLCFSILLFVLNIKVTIKDPKRFLKLLGCTILVILITAFFWAPMIEQLRVQKLKLSEPWTNIENDDYSLYDYLSNEKYSIGLSVTLSLPFVIYGLVKGKLDKKGKKFLLYFTILSVILVCSFIWEKFSTTLNIIQFRWRLLGIITSIYALTITMLFNNICIECSNEKIEIIIIIIISILMLLMISNYYFNEKINIDRLNNEIHTNFFSLGGGAEYLPIEVKDVLKIYQMNPNIAYAGKNEVMGTKDLCLRYELSNKGINEKEITIPFIYYYGYVANLTTDSGEVHELDVSKSNDGFVKINIDDGAEGNIIVWYNGTKTQKISLLISVSTIFITIGVLIIKKIKKR